MSFPLACRTVTVTESAQSRAVRHLSARGRYRPLLADPGWYKNFPPTGVDVVSWYVLMGVGQVVTLRFAAEKLRDINQLIEREAWGAASMSGFAVDRLPYLGDHD
jgi:hypothetical protein